MKIEKGIAPPPVKGPRPIEVLEPLINRMEVGDSILTTYANTGGLGSAMAEITRRMERPGTYRMAMDGNRARVWRVS